MAEEQSEFTTADAIERDRRLIGEMKAVERNKPHSVSEGDPGYGEPHQG